MILLLFVFSVPLCTAGLGDPETQVEVVQGLRAVCLERGLRGSRGAPAIG